LFGQRRGCGMESSFLDEGVAHTWAEARNKTTDGIGIGLPGLLRSTRSLILTNTSIPLNVCILKVKLPYPIGLALILERTKRIYGNEKLTEMLGIKSQICHT
ncbi:MAG TPA: hypothetical protein PLA69_05770, partial [Flavobacterium sp.]|nr:hypothetical protein [Flavobacterium sp.]